MRIVVIGGVAAGMSAASQAKRRAPSRPAKAAAGERLARGLRDVQPVAAAGRARGGGDGQCRSQAQ